MSDWRAAWTPDPTNDIGRPMDLGKIEVPDRLIVGRDLMELGPG